MDGPSQHYVYDGDMVIGEITKTGGATGYPSAVYTWGPDGLISERLDPTAVNGSPKSLWYHYGPQGETRQLTDSLGVITDWYVYDAYGMPVASLTPNTNPFRYGGQFGYYTLPTLNVICCGARWYDPQMGRWFSRDPIGYEGGENLYTYCDCDPVGSLDAEGAQSDARIISKETYDRRWRIITEGTYQRERNQYLRVLAEARIKEFLEKTDWSSAVPVAGPVNAAKRVGLLARGWRFVRALFSRGGARAACRAAGSIAARRGSTKIAELIETHGITESKNYVRALMKYMKNHALPEGTIKYVVHQGKKYIVDGHHRVLAAKLLGWSEIRAQEVHLPYAGYKTFEDLRWTPY